ncbi:MAG: hypothetical protein KBT48_08435 [Firmicutes bacterium]|nr:hypothetical protein [Bacillota bacterium]
MPYLQIRVSCAVSYEQKEEIVKDLSPKIVMLPGKSEEKFMIEIVDQCDLYFGGSKEKTNAYINLCINAYLDKEYLEAYTKEVCTCLNKVLKIDYSQIFITHQVLSPWIYAPVIMK